MEIHEDRLAGFRTEISDMFIVENGTDVSFHHEVEFARRSQVGGTAVRTDLRVGHLIDAVTRLAVFAVAHDVAETVDVTGSLPDFRMADDRGVESYDVVAFFHHFAPPELFDCALHRGSVRAVIPETVEAAVNFRALKHKTAALAQRHDLVHQLAFRSNSHKNSFKIKFIFNW